MTPTVLIAPDKFKGSLTAAQVADALAAGLTATGASCRILPLADGGDGSVDAAVAAGHRRHQLTVAGATGLPRRASIAVSAHAAVVEVADTCGLATLPGGRPRPLDATTLGFGQAVRRALQFDRPRLVLALGGSASTDGGLGLLAASGFEFFDATGHPVYPRGRDLARVTRVDAERRIPLHGIEVVVAGDVTNPLLGVDGAAAVYGPQKGASPGDVAVLDRGLASIVEVLAGSGFPAAPALAAAPGAGAAGGLGFAALLLGARMSSGAHHFLDLLGFDTAVAGADLVVTGEGCIDEQSGRGKLISAVVTRSHPTPVVAVAGRTTLSRSQQRAAGLSMTHTLGAHSSRDTRTDPRLSAEILATIGRTIGAGLRDDAGQPSRRP
ncbi:glycerate kinase [Mycolicibacterium sp.]|uniref:glycerate kinase n=1 Tax=Mycolicibacterium sp. TaxID=2320850 RepID=UPI003D0B4ACD